MPSSQSRGANDKRPSHAAIVIANPPIRAPSLSLSSSSTNSMYCGTFASSQVFRRSSRVASSSNQGLSGALQSVVSSSLVLDSFSRESSRCPRIVLQRDCLRLGTAYSGPSPFPCAYATAQWPHPSALLSLNSTRAGERSLSVSKLSLHSAADGSHSGDPDGLRSAALSSRMLRAAIATARSSSGPGTPPSRGHGLARLNAQLLRQSASVFGVRLCAEANPPQLDFLGHTFHRAVGVGE